MKNMVLSLISTFTTTLRDVIFPFHKDSKERYVPTSEEKNHFPTLNFYILDGKHIVLEKKKNIENDKYQPPLNIFLLDNLDYTQRCS